MARDFDGSNQYLSASSSLVSGAPATLACWFNADVDNASLALLSQSKSGSDVSRFQLWLTGTLSGDPIRASHYGTEFTGHAQSSSGFTVGTWHHAAGVFVSNSERSVFIDGGSKGTDTTSVSSTAFDLTTIAARETDSIGLFLDGKIAEVGFWDVALTDAEIKSLAEGYSPLFVRPQNLIGYWPLFARNSNEEDWTQGFLLTNQNGAAKAEHPSRILYPVRNWAPIVIQGGAEATVSVGLASELSSAFAVSRLKQKAVGLSAETDTALATSSAKITAVGLSTETDTAFSILRSKIKAAGLSTETDSAFALIISSAVNVGLSAETDSATAISRLKQKPVGLSTEADTALSIGRSKIKIAGLGIETDVAFTISRSKLKALGLSSELDQALAISSSGSLAVGLASELDVALVIGRLKQQLLGQSSETDLSQPVSKIKTQQAGLSVESDSALAVTGSSGRAVGLATETDLAQSISRIKQRLVGLSPETNVALAVTIGGVTVIINTSAKETLKLLAENPTLTLSAENATLTLT